MSHTNIYKQNGKYVIIKVIYNKRITYGAYDTLDEAIKQRNKLRIYKWIKCRTTGYSKEESFPKYVVREDFKKNMYIVTNKETGKTFGAYNNQHYASIIKNILPYHQDDIDINHVERIAHKVFYKHISLNKRTNRYHVEYKSYVRGTYTNLVDALYERDIIVKYNGDEELMCEDTTTIYDYKRDPLPPFHLHRKENITYEATHKNKYKLKKQVDNKPLLIGYYPTYNLALLIKRYLDKNKWNEETVKHITHVTEIIHKRDKHIHRRNNIYYVELTRDNKTTIYAKYKDINKARFVRNSLQKNHWDKKSINKLENMYEDNNITTKYYYDDTDYLKSN